MIIKNMYTILYMYNTLLSENIKWINISKKPGTMNIKV